MNFTSYRYVIDAYAWIEYFRASKAGEAAKQYIESEESATPTIVVSEVSRKLQNEVILGNETQAGKTQRLEFMRTATEIIDLDFETAAKAGETDSRMKRERRGWGLADSIILCTANAVEGKVVTGDEHFRGLEEVILIKK